MNYLDKRVKVECRSCGWIGDINIYVLRLYGVLHTLTLIQQGELRGDS